MHVEILGGGPAGLTLAILLKRADAAHRVRVVERGPRDATWGFGVVFSDRALEFLRADAPDLHEALAPQMQSWHDLTIVHSGVHIPISGNGFASIGRLRLLNLLHRQAEAAGVELEFGRSVADVADLGPADLLVAADGAFSASRDARAGTFGTRVDWRHNRFVWYGTSRPFDTLTLTFRTHATGVFCAHHYRYAPDMSTFLVEVDEATYRRAGLETMSEADSLRLCEEVFAPDLDGHALQSNRSTWRRFPAVWNERWSAGNVVLIGDALRTAHFSIGSGTRLAMEDAIALARALQAEPRIDGALQRFQAERLPPMKKIWDAANVSLQWYEGMGAMMDLDPHEFAYRYMTRSGRVDHAEVRRRDPALAAAYERLHPEVLRGA
jgi:2-polyprenyl-6-methoxyphenol hydroxylase-like FAD-dependent oxidoreductase